MQIDLPQLDDLSQRDLELLRRSFALIMAKLARGEVKAEQVVQTLMPLTAPPKPKSGASRDVKAPPEVAPAEYSKKAKMLPSVFLQRVYAPWIAAGLLFQDDIRRVDKRLMRALDKEYAGRRDELKALLPTSYARKNCDRIARQLEAMGKNLHPQVARRLATKAPKAVGRINSQLTPTG